MAAFTNKEKEYIIRMIKEAREELDRLEKQMKEEEEVGFGEDEIFLLSTEEYEKYKDKIPEIYGNWWWLRSRGVYSDCATFINTAGGIDYNGSIVYKNYGGVRPALKLNGEYVVGERIVLYSFPWIVIDKNLAIAEVPIGFTIFNTDEKNRYCDSYIRAHLKRWLENRSEASNVTCKEF